MNEESVSSIIKYLQQYSDQSTEALVQNLMQSGYTTPDIKEALRRLGMSPIVIPGYKEQMPMPGGNRSLMPIIIIGSIVVVLLLGGIAFVLTKSSPTSEPEQKSTDISEEKVASASLSPAVTEKSIQEISPTILYENFKKEFTLKDYKVTYSSKNNSSEYKFYTKKGKVFRYDYDIPYRGGYIFKEDKIYGISFDEKKYVDFSGTRIGETLENLFIPNVILSEVEKGKMKLDTVEGNTVRGYWSAKEPMKHFTDYDITITFDPDTHLVKTFLNEPTDTISETDLISLQYEEVSNIDSFGIIPNDFILVQEELAPTPLLSP